MHVSNNLIIPYIKVCTALLLIKTNPKNKPASKIINTRKNSLRGYRLINCVNTTLAITYIIPTIIKFSYKPIPNLSNVNCVR